MKIVELPAARHKMVRSMMEWMGQEMDRPALRAQARNLEAAELYWVTEDMVRVAVDASSDMPAFTLNGLIPEDRGFIFFAAPLPDLAILLFPTHELQPGEPLPEMPVDWMFWWREGETINVQYGCTKDRQLTTDYEEIGPDIPFSPMASIVVPARGADATIVPDTEESLREANMTQQGLSRMRAIVMLAAVWAMMQQPTVAEQRRERLEPTKNEYKRGRRPGTVTTVTLRRLRHEEKEYDSSGRKLTERHIVRGHWKQQAYGPERSLRKPLYIAPYVVGPADAPLKGRERVMVWRR